jgi:hypothetical protein
MSSPSVTMCPSRRKDVRKLRPTSCSATPRTLSSPSGRPGECASVQSLEGRDAQAQTKMKMQSTKRFQPPHALHPASPMPRRIVTSKATSSGTVAAQYMIRKAVTTFHRLRSRPSGLMIGSQQPARVDRAHELSTPADLQRRRGRSLLAYNTRRRLREGSGVPAPTCRSSRERSLA